ncbi:MAG TPA: hypothetical protein VFH54_15885 [Mycobacteriales bacterium]|nr:hypothetical protein [Mycobacteriales bacterium]
MRRPLRATRRQLEILVLELVDRTLRLAGRVRLPRRVRLSGMVRQPRWLVAAAALLVPVVAAGALLVQRASAHPGAARVISAPDGVQTEPAPPTPAATIDPALFAAAAKRPAAAPALTRLPQVDLNGLSVAGIPKAALAAYVTGARMADQEDQSCHLRWWVLAGIGLVESGHAHDGGSTAPKWNGIAKPPIFGPELDGKHGFAAIKDTDQGKLDGDKKWDRAVGPMQFLPSTWVSWGGTNHGKMRNPQDIRAAALAAARYLCAGSADLSQAQGMQTAVYSYNHSFDYVRLVLTVAARYAGIDPNSLGVNKLPHDKKAKPAAKKASPTPTSSASSSSTGSTSPAPAPSSTSSGGSSPAPTSTQQPILPLPTPSGTPFGIGSG